MSMPTPPLLEHGTPSEEGLPYSSFVRAGDYIYLSGLVGFDDTIEIVNGGVAAETERILDVASEILTQAGSALADVVKVNVCLQNAADFDDFNTAYKAYFPVNPPARATICAGLTVAAKVEIELIAYQPRGACSG